MPAIKIKIEIAGRQYPLTIESDEEITLRKAGVEINKMVKTFEKKFAVSDKQDVLAMICLQLSGKLAKLQNESSDNSTYLVDEIKQLKQLLADAVS